MRYFFFVLAMNVSFVFAETETKPAEAQKKEGLPAQAYYTHPGVVISRGDYWAGSDHLLNISKNIDVIVEIIKPDEVQLPISQAELEKSIRAEFQKHGIGSKASEGGSLQLPFFDMLIVVYPVELGYAGIVNGRLFESVDPIRVKLEPETKFQAITWEKKTLIVSPKDDFKSLVESTVNNIVQTFLERYDYFEDLKVKMQSPDTIERMR